MGEYLPKPYRSFVEKYPEIADAYQRLGQTCHEAGPLDAKTRHLVKLGIASAMKSEGGVKANTRKTLDAGGTEEEVRHTVLLSMTSTGFPGMIAAMDWVDEVLQARK